MNPTVIIIPGLDASTWIWPFNYLVQLYCWYFKLDIKKDNPWTSFQEFLLDHGLSNVIILDPPPGIFQKPHILPAGQKLAKLIDGSPADKVILFAYSLGASVAKAGIGQVTKKDKVIKLICVASPHSKEKMEVPDSVQTFNIYSDADIYLDFINVALYVRGYKKIANAKNLQIPNLKHPLFSKNSPIKTEDGELNLFDYYLKIIINS